MVKPQLVVLDVNETLFSLDALDPVFEQFGLAGQRDLWFARTLRSGFALTCSGDYRTFPEVARNALRSLAAERIGAPEQDALMAAFAHLDPHPDVAPALRALREAEVPVVTLSVGNAANVERLFDRAGLADLVDVHLSCESVQRWKPAREPYLHACEVLDVHPPDAWMVAAHSWDIGGAASVGMRTAWVSRLESAFDSSFGAPDVSGTDLVKVVEHLLM
jgi:2-haloacid dehalogenase